MKKIFLITLFLLANNFLLAQELKTFQFYNKKGQSINYNSLLLELQNYDVILFGEHHNNSTNHWLQLQLTKSLSEAKANNLILGAEMFERDNQKVLTDYILHKIPEDVFKEKVRFWSNYKTDYKPIVDFAKENKLEFIATNIPRKYASQVSKNGLESLDTLSIEEKKWIVNLPFPIDYNSPGYPEMMRMMEDHMELKAKQFVDAQAIKDATMAESILKVLNKDKIFLHFNGDYHSKQYGGIYWYLKNKKPELKIAVIQIMESADPNLKLPKLTDEFSILTEFTLVLPKDTIKTY